MFLELALKRQVQLEARLVHPNGYHRRTVILKLLQQIREAEYNEEHRYYYVAPTVLGKVGEGRVVDGSGNVAFEVEFRCLAFRLFRNEFVEVEVMEVAAAGCRGSCGPCDCVLVAELPQGGFKWNKSRACFRNVTGKAEQEIKVGSLLRVKVETFEFREGLGKFCALAKFVGVVSDLAS